MWMSDEVDETVMDWTVTDLCIQSCDRLMLTCQRYVLTLLSTALQSRSNCFSSLAFRLSLAHSCYICLVVYLLCIQFTCSTFLVTCSQLPHFRYMKLCQFFFFSQD